VIGVFRALSQRAFALLWSGQTISRLGDSLYMIALAWWVLVNTRSAAAMGLVLICSTVPMLFLLLLGGVAVDRLPRIRLMIASDILRGLVVGVVALLAFQHRLELWQICTMSALFGTVQAFFYPAYTAIIPSMVAADMLPSANSLRVVSLQVAQTIGPALGAGIVAACGSPLAFALDSASFGISAACLALIGSSPKISSISRQAGALDDLRMGIRTVITSPWLWITISIASVSTIFLDGPHEAVLPLLVKQRFGTHVGLFGLLTSLSALGAISAALWLGRFTRLRHRGWVTYGAWILASVTLLIVGLPTSAFEVGLAFLVQGAAISTLGLAWTNTLQECVPADLLGRVASIDMLMSSALVPIGYALAGITADRVGAPLVFVLGGAISSTVITLGLLHPAIRSMD